MMEDEERQRKLQAGKAKLAEYRQKKAQADGQKKQKKKKKKPEVEVEEAVRDEEGGQPAEEQRGAPNTVFTLNKSLRSGETVTHDQTYTIEPESEVSTTAEDCSSEVNGFLEKTEAELESSMIREEDLNQPEPHMEPELQSGGPQSRMQIMEDELAAKNIAVEELSRELEEIRAAIGTEGVQQLQDFEEALKQRDEIITQLTANLQQARTEKEEVMREFLELTEQSQKLQIQFQQLQAGEILRSSNISSTAADLLQTRQQLTLHQQQLDEKDAEVKGHQQKAEEHLSVISELQERLNEAERVRTKAEESFTQSLREKDQLNNEHQRLISEHLQSAAQLQDQLLTSQQHLEDVKKHLAVKSEELERSERELSASRQKERMSSGEILQLMKTVEDLQRRCHQGSQSESEMVQRLEEDWSRRLERLRAELDELHGQQIVEMKQELRLQHAAEVERIGAQHAADMEKILQQHQSELERVKGHLSDSSGEVNVLNVKLVDFQKKLQETQVLRERAEQEVVHMSEEKLTLVRQAERLQQELQNTRVEIELRAQSPERSQMEMRLLHDEINDLQMQLAAAQQATGELEAKHESEITNYKIKLEMLEREKNAVLDTLAESQEAELERLRTDLLFSHEEELVKLRDDLQRENQLNLENLRDEMNTRHREATERLRVNYEDQLRATKGERTALAEERDALKHDHALERSRTEELISQLREMQTEVEDLRRRTEEETEVKDTKSENQSLKKTNTVMSEELKSLIEERQHLLQNIDDLSTDNQQIHQQVKDLQDKIEKQTNTFSFAEKNFEVNYQELKEEYRCLVNTKIQLEERITKETMEYEAKLHDLQIMLETLQRRTQTKPSTDKMEDEEREMEKDTTELMEKLETAEREKRRLEEKLSETVSTVTLMESDAKQLEEDLKMVRRERDEIVRRNKELETQRRTDEERGGAEEKHDLHVRSLTEEEEEALHTSLLSVVEERSSDQQLRVLTQKKHAPLERPALSESVDGGPSPHTAEREEGRERETDQSTTDRRLLTHTRAAASEERLPQPDGRRALQLQENTGEVLADGVNIRTQCMMHRQEMNGSEHDECRLRLEAQRISLSQIHAAQLELLRESLLEQTQAELRSQEQHLRDAHARELRCMQEEVQRERQGVRGHAAGSSGSFGPSQVCRFIDDVSEECRQIIQSFSVVLGEEVVDLQRSESSEITDQTLLNLNTTDLTALIHHARELYGGLKQMLDGVLSAHRRLMDLQHSLKRERQMETSEQQILSGEQEIRSVCPPLDSSDLVPSAVSQELQEGSAHLQESHRREIEELKIFYQRQLEETEKSLSAEILLLKEKLQELTETEQTCSVSSISQTLMRPQRCETLQDDDDEEGLALRELQGVRDADESERSDLQQEKHHQELLQEEIAKVIVQMSVEFAQQTEIARINKQARETTTAAQTHSTEDEEEMKRDEQLKETSEEERLRADSQRETDPQQMHEREQERERERDEHAYPSMQSSSTQTKQKKDEEEEEDEVTKGGGHKRAEVTSAEDPELTSEATTRITTERDLLRESNERLRLVLLDVLKTTAAVEETIGRHVEGILEASSKSPLRTTRRNIPADEFKPHSRLTAEPAGVPHTDASTDGLHGSETGTDDVSVFSAETETDEGLEMSRRTQGVELQIQEAELELEREECLMGISSRLQSAVEKLLITITETTGQLEHAHITQTELMKEKFRHNEEMEELLHRQEELQERLCEEATAREQLALELHKAEGLIDGYTGERLALEQQLRSRAELQLHLEQELHVTSSRLQELEHERLQILQERELLSRQQDAMRDGAGARELRLVDAALDAAPEADLLEETEKLMAEKVEVQRQAQKESSELQWQVKQLEAELEEQMTRLQELQEVKRMEEADLTQQIQALEKQLEHNRKFMDEQAADREHERDVFQQEIYNLEHQLKSLPKTLTGNEHRDRELEELTRVLQDKSDWCSDLLLRSEQLQREVEERDEELERVTARVRELEHTLLNRAAVEEVQHVCMAGRGDVTLEAQLQTEREALDRKEKEIVNLEEQLEQFREELENKSEEVNQLHMQLEIQRKEISSQQEVLQNQTRLTQVLEEKDREIKVLREQSAKHQRTGTYADTQVLEERDEVVRELESQVEHLQSEQDRLKRNSEEEVDQLNAVIEKLQQELSNIEHKQSEEEEQAVGREEYEEMKLKADTLTADNCALLSRCESLEREASTGRRLQEELQEKTAALVVVQAQVQALEQSAGLKVTCLSERVEELQVCVQEKDSELQVCRLNVQQAQSDADALHLKISLLEEKLREKVAAVLVSQAQLGAVQVQTKELHAEALSDEAEVSVETETLRCSESSSAPTQKLSALTEKLQELEESLNGMQKDQELQKHLLCSSEDELQEYETRLAVLMDLLNQMRTKPAQNTPAPSAEVSADDSLSASQLLHELQEVKGQAAIAQKELNCNRELNHKLREEIEIKENTIDQLQTALSQVSASACEEDSAATAGLLHELQEVKGQVATTKEELDRMREQSVMLQDAVQEREMSIALLKDQLHTVTREGEQSVSQLLQELQEVKGQAESTKEELNSQRERGLKLQEEMEVRDLSISQLKEKLQELQDAFAQTSDEPAAQSKKKGGKHGDSKKHHGKNKSADTSEDTSHKNSSDQSERTGSSSSSLNRAPSSSRAEAGTQTDLSQEEDVEEMIAGYSEKIGQMQELHAAEILDMEARHISESESLKNINHQLQDECRALRDTINKLRTNEGPSVRSDQPSPTPFRDEYTSDSGSDWSQRTGCDVSHPQQEFRTTPEGSRRDPEPDLLPDRIKTLLREVHQEGMQVLSLSELDTSTHIPPHTWSKERDSLINTVESLKSLISKLQSSSDTQAGLDWRAELLSAVQQVFFEEREVLKSLLYSHLERMDTADAVVHLSGLERALAEQESRHGELMAVLCSADRRSLLTEIRQLRDQLDTAGLGSERERDLVSGGSGSDRHLLEKLKTELAQTKLELENNLNTHHKHLKELDTLRLEVSQKVADIDSLNDRLVHEQKNVRELQWTLEKERCKSDRQEEREREEVEDLKLTLDEQRAHVAELSLSLETERQISAQLREQVQEVGVSSELQVQLDSQRSRADELRNALEREKELNTQLIQKLQTGRTAASPQQGSETLDSLLEADATCSQVEAGVLSVESLLQTLQTQLLEKQRQVERLMEEVERQKLMAVQNQREREEEKSALIRSAAQDQSALQTTRDGLQRRTHELQSQLDAETQTVQQLERERDRLQERATQLEERVRQLEATGSVGQQADRTRDWVLQQKTAESSSVSLCDAQHTQTTSDPTHMNNIINRLQLIAAKINSLTRETSDNMSMEGPDRESLVWLHSNVQDVMSLLQHIPSAPSAVPESAALLVGGSSSLLNECLLRQNAELTGFVSRLTEEKSDLRNQLLKLEEELRRYRQKHISSDHVSSRSGSDRQDLVLFCSERESWAQERSRLEKSLRQAEAELTRLRGEIRSDALRELTGPDADNAALKRMYGKYLRAESFRKALIYQKKYLLLLLGGFQECEDATLSLIARMGGRPTHACLESLTHHRRGFTRFRSAVRVSIALSRMRFLVKRWQKAAGGGSSSSPILNRNGLAQITGADVRNESSYLQPGSVEVYRERRATSRGRTGRESPRSSASVQHRYHSVAVDSGGLPCSHLQNYDPDRALTDYITRLEALQRRLGSVQSGSTSYAQMHFGMRR